MKVFRQERSNLAWMDPWMDPWFNLMLYFGTVPVQSGHRGRDALWVEKGATAAPAEQCKSLQESSISRNVATFFKELLED